MVSLSHVTILFNYFLICSFYEAFALQYRKTFVRNVNISEQGIYFILNRMEHCTYSEKVPYNIIIEKMFLLKSNHNFLFYLILLQVAYAENLTEFMRCSRLGFPYRAVFIKFPKNYWPRAVSPKPGVTECAMLCVFQPGSAGEQGEGVPGGDHRRDAV